jgi:hypothetical protein
VYYEDRDKALDYAPEPTDRDEENLRVIMAGTRIASEEEGKGLEQRNMADEYYASDESKN